MTLALTLDKVETAQVCIGHAGWYAAVVLQAYALDTVKGFQINLVDRRFISEEDKGKPAPTKFRREVNCLLRFLGCD